MSKKPVFLMFLAIILMGVLGASFNVHKVEAQLGTIYIRADGSIDPSTANITSSDNVTYTFTADINASLVIEKNDIVVDGADFTVQGSGSGIGIDLSYRNNVTLQNVEVTNFTFGIYLNSSSNNIVSDNIASSNNQDGIRIQTSSYNTITGNTASNVDSGIFLSKNSSYNTITGNNATSNGDNGIILGDSNYNTVTGNNASSNGNGIYLGHSSNNTVSGNIASNNGYGIYLYSSSNNTIIGNIALNNGDGIFFFYLCYNNTITGNTISNNTSNGIQLYSCNHNTITGNTASNNNAGINTNGIFLFDSSYNTIASNTASNNDDGISLWSSSNNTISGNNITGNSDDGIYLSFSSDNTILSNTFSSNLNNGIYLEESSDNTILKNMDFSDSGYGILLWSGSHRNIIYENILSPRDRGIVMGYSNDNRILNNTVSRTGVVGIEIQQICNNSTIANNMVSESNECGIRIISMSEETRYNAIVGNNIMHSLIGISIIRLSGNVIYHNNFVNNTNQASISNSTNIWDDDVEGNYWSNYTGVDSNRDGIGDSWHEISENNTDRYPLMGMFHSFNTSVGEYVNVISNSTIEGFQYFESNSTIRMHVSNMTANQTHGFCRISIPYEVMSEPFNVTIDGANPTYWNYTLYDNGTHRWIYFEYEHTTLEIVIIPEFPSSLLLLLFMIATLLAVKVYIRKQ